MNFKELWNSLECKIFLVGLILFIAVVGSSWEYPLMGIHSHRQADTLFAAYSYCKEQSSFLLPKIAHREDTSGVVIGEFPLFSYFVSIPCQLTGVWSEAWGKLFPLILFLLSSLVWAFFLAHPLSQFRNKNLLVGFVVIFVFSTNHLLHLTIPIPDVLAVFFIGLAGILNRSEKKWQRWTAIGFFAVGFAIRPYFFPLVGLIFPAVVTSGIVTLACVAVYLFWYKHWVNYSVLSYYATDTKTIDQVISELPRALSALPFAFLRNHLNFVLVVPFLFAVLKEKKLAFLWLFSWFLVVGLKGDHSVDHGYYLGAACLLALVIAWKGLLEFKPKVLRLKLNS